MNKSSSTNIDSLKKAMLKALHETLGVVSPAVEQVGIHRSTHYNWMKSDEQYKQDVEDIQEFQLDFVESKLFENINSNDVPSTIFYLKTRGRKRGYIEKQEIDQNLKVTGINPIEWVTTRHVED